MKIIQKIKTSQTTRSIYFLGIKIFTYKKKEKENNSPVSCDIFNYEKLLLQGTKFPHLLGIVISRHATIGNNCRIYQNVTIGSKNANVNTDNIKENYPTIGNNVTIYAGAVICGPIKIGNNVTIRANSVVLTDIPDNATAVGIPAKILPNKKA